jgi:hypothetical protein
MNHRRAKKSAEASLSALHRLHATREPCKGLSPLLLTPDCFSGQSRLVLAEFDFLIRHSTISGPIWKIKCVLRACGCGLERRTPVHATGHKTPPGLSYSLRPIAPPGGMLAANKGNRDEDVLIVRLLFQRCSVFTRFAVSGSGLRRPLSSERRKKKVVHSRYPNHLNRT